MQIAPVAKDRIADRNFPLYARLFRTLWEIHISKSQLSFINYTKPSSGITPEAGPKFRTT